MKTFPLNFVRFSSWAIHLMTSVRYLIQIYDGIFVQPDADSPKIKEMPSATIKSDATKNQHLAHRAILRHFTISHRSYGLSVSAVALFFIFIHHSFMPSSWVPSAQGDDGAWTPRTSRARNNTRTNSRPFGKTLSFSSCRDRCGMFRCGVGRGFTTQMVFHGKRLRT